MVDMIHPDTVAASVMNRARQMKALTRPSATYMSATYSLLPSGDRSQLCIAMLAKANLSRSGTHMASMPQTTEIHLRIAFMHVFLTD